MALVGCRFSHLYRACLSGCPTYFPQLRPFLASLAGPGIGDPGSLGGRVASVLFSWLRAARSVSRCARVPCGLYPSVPNSPTGVVLGDASSRGCRRIQAPLPALASLRVSNPAAPENIGRTFHLVGRLDPGYLTRRGSSRGQPLGFYSLSLGLTGFAVRRARDLPPTIADPVPKVKPPAPNGAKSLKTK